MRTHRNDMSPNSEPHYHEQIQDLRLPPAAPTAWGIPVLDTAGLHEATSGPPTGYTHRFLKKDIIQWLDPHIGGVTIILHDQGSPISELTRAPEPVGAFELVSKEYTVGQSPARYGTFPTNLSRHLGFRVLAHTDILTAVQMPGINSYKTAFTNINGKPPDIVTNVAKTGLVQGQDFIDMVTAGEWPYDMHFYDAHGPGFVIGGPEYIAAIRGMVRLIKPDCPKWQVDFIGGRIDSYADILRQGKTAMERVRRFTRSDLVEDLYTDVNRLDSVYPEIRTIMRRFNYVVSQYFGTSLPGTELPDRPIPL